MSVRDGYGPCVSEGVTTQAELADTAVDVDVDDVDVDVLDGLD
jgi:hypothetical protein